MNKGFIERATEDVLQELKLKTWRFDVKAVRSVPHGEISQIRLFDAIGRDKVAVVNFQRKKKNTGRDLKELKARIRAQLNSLVAVDG